MEANATLAQARHEMRERRELRRRSCGLRLLGVGARVKSLEILDVKTLVDFRVLDASVPTEREAWIAQWHAWPEREVMAHPDYVALFTATGQRALCATAGTPAGGALFPFILRPLSLEPWATSDETRSDLTTPYGYGGAFCWGDTTTLSADFWPAFGDWARERGVVNLFARLSLFPEQQIDFDGTVTERQSNVVRTLGLPAEDLWRDYAHKVRKNVSKARRSGLNVEIDEDAARLANFLTIYSATMDRRAARSDYYFSESFFRTLAERLPGQYAFFHVLHQDRIVSTELVLVSATHMYSFLGGTLKDAFDLRPNDLLKHAVIEWGAARGKRAFVLGGGYGADDGIFRYKLSFAPTGAVPFRIGTRIFDASANSELIAARTEWARSLGEDWQVRDDFFPAYRA
jgi:hypothetical protein